MLRRMARALASLPQWAEVGHPRLHLPGPWVNEEYEQHGRFSEDMWEEPTSTSIDSCDPDMEDGCRPFHKVYRVDISHFPALRETFRRDIAYHVVDGKREEKEIWQRRRDGRKRALEEDRDAHHLPVRVETFGHRRWRSSWLTRVYDDTRGVCLAVEDPEESRLYQEKLDQNRGAKELLPWDLYMELCMHPDTWKTPPSWEAQGELCFEYPGPIWVWTWLCLLPAELQVLLWQYYIERANEEWLDWPPHNSSYMRPPQPWRLHVTEVYERESSVDWPSTAGLHAVERVPFCSPHRRPKLGPVPAVHVVPRVDHETWEGAGRCYTINV
jgi:hypothetical protein